MGTPELGPILGWLGAIGVTFLAGGMVALFNGHVGGFLVCLIIGGPILWFLSKLVKPRWIKQ